MRRLGFLGIIAIAALLLLAVARRPVLRLVRGGKSTAVAFAKDYVKRHRGKGDLPTVSAASAEPQTVVEGPVVRYHEVVRPKRLDAWSIIGPGGGGTFY